MAGLLLMGRVNEVEPVNGEGYSYLRVWIAAGPRDVIPARLGDNYGPAPREGQDVTAEAAYRAFTRKDGSAGVGFTLVRPVHVKVEGQPEQKAG